MRNVFLAIVFLFHSGFAAAENTTPYPGTQVVETGKPFAVFFDNLLGAIKANKMGVVAQACADCGAKSIGVTIAKNRVIMIFRPDFAVRMLKASVAAGIEAPLRLYVTEQADGNARLTYRLPSRVFGVYGVRELDEMAAELDGIVAKIVTDATAG
ncbi:MAG: DUF302 domain-containing protein [Rhodospirillales bacterium]|jgi:uncharacterized protein (DUF302 family)|nr:DUF302 domain-containing protein [Rhodospirillales bacterium]